MPAPDKHLPPKNSLMALPYVSKKFCKLRGTVSLLGGKYGLTSKFGTQPYPLHRPLTPRQ
jgi:hypothetical protein